MSSDNAPEDDVVVAQLLCWVCEAEVVPGNETCYRCGIRFAEASPNPFVSPAAHQGIEKETSNVSALVSILLTLGLICVLGVVAVSSPGMAIGLSLLTIPPWIRTTLVMFKRSRSGLKTSHLAMTSLFFGSALVTWLILFVALISCCLTFCATCWVALISGSFGRGNNDTFSYVLFGSVGVTFLLVMAALGPWIYHRWQRDTTKGG